MNAKVALIGLPLIWNFLILLVFGGLQQIAFSAMYSALLGVAIGLAIAAGVKVFGMGISDESVHLAFIAGTLSAFYGLFSLGVLFGQTGGTPVNQITFFGIPLPNLAPSSSIPATGSKVLTGGGELWINQIPFGYAIEGIFAVMYIIGIVLYCSRTSD